MRSRYKLPYFGTFIWNLFFKQKPISTMNLYTTNRKITLHYLFSSLVFYLHNGKTFYQVLFTTKKQNTKIGEFSITKKTCVFKSKKKKKQKLNKKNNKKKNKKKKK